MKHSPAGINASPPAPEIFLLHGISLALSGNLSKNHFDMILIDAPVSYRAPTTMLLTFNFVQDYIA